MNTAYPDNGSDSALRNFGYLATHVPFVPPQPAKLNPWLATLASRNIPVVADMRGKHPVLWVPEKLNRTTQALLADYETANADWPRHRRALLRSTRAPLFTDLALIAFLLFQAALFRFFLFIESSAPRRAAWHNLGAWKQHAILESDEWWRCITALTLHADAHHALSNCLWGFIFGALTASRIGTGITLLLMLLSGTLGNAAMAAISNDGHQSIGASTMGFGLLGILTAIHTIDMLKIRERGRGIIRLIPWVPLACGIAMGTLAAAAPGADILAHVCGFACGLALGALIHACPNLIASLRLQSLAALAALSTFALAWFAAFLA